MKRFDVPHAISISQIQPTDGSCGQSLALTEQSFSILTVAFLT